MPLFDLKLASGKTVVSGGRTPEDAARNYIDTHRDAVVIATRLAKAERTNMIVTGSRRMQIIEPGHRDWGKR